MQTGQDHPLPPADFPDREIEIVTIAPPTVLFRIHETAYSPIFFGLPFPHRFDAPKQYGVIYAGIDEYVAFLETIRGQVSNGLLDRNGRISEYSISQLTTTRSIRLVKASGANLERMGANSGIFATKNRQITQQWSLACWQHSQRFDGIIYPSCHDNERFCVALYNDRIDGILSIQSTREILSDSFRDRLTEITRTYRYSLFPELDD
jgi:RES domain